MKKILYILKHNPWGVGGGSYASNLYLSAFLNVFSDYHFDVLICDYCLELEHKKYDDNCHFIPVPKRGVTKVFSVFSGIMHRYQKKAKEMLGLNDYEYCIFDHSQIAGSLLAFIGPKTKSIVLHHNFEQKYYHDNTKSVLVRCCFSHYVSKWEKKAFLNSTYNVFLTKEDLEQFRSTYGLENGSSIVGGIFDIDDASRNLDCRISSDSPFTCVITGSLDNVQNVDGLQYFFEELYPLLPNNIQIIIAGKNPVKLVYQLAAKKSNVRIIANPLKMESVIEEGNVFICPTKLGSGIKVRVTDGLREGLPVIAHNVSVRGYSDFCERGYMYSFETKEEFISSFHTIIKKLESNPQLYNEIQKYYSSTHSFTGGVENLKNMILR